MGKVLEEFKSRMRISHGSEDEMLSDVLEISYEDVKSLIGDFEMDDYKKGKELVFERARYACNDSLEYFYDNFQQRIMDVSLDLKMRGG